MFEIRASQLSFNGEEAGTLLNMALGFKLSREDAETLLKRTEGWPAGLYLAALSLRDHPDPSQAIRNFAGNDRNVVDYITEEVLERQPPEVARFLIRTSIPERLTGSLCDAVVDENGSDEQPERLEHSNLFLVPLDKQRGWYRYHHLFADLLRSELIRGDPELTRVLHQRASEWYRNQGWIQESTQHAIAAGDLEIAAELISRNWVPFIAAGRI